MGRYSTSHQNQTISMEENVDKSRLERFVAHLEYVVEVFCKTGTLYENYAPEYADPGQPAKKDFVGWTGLTPVSTLFEYVFGIRPDCANQKIVWHINLKERHSVRQYPFSEDVTISLLEDYLLRLDVICAAADMDVLRMPSHKVLFSGISDFREQISEAVVFFQSLWDDVIRTHGEPERDPAGDLTFQGSLLLFYLKGEIQKLEPHLSQSQKAAFDDICEKMSAAVHQAYPRTGDTDVKEIMHSFQDIYEKLTTEAEKLGLYGNPIQFIADEIRRATIKDLVNVDKMLQAYEE